MKSVNPYLNFRGNTLEAFTFYASVFGTEIQDKVYYRDFPDNAMGVAEADLDKLAHIALPLGSGALLMATDVVGAYAEDFTVGNNVFITLEADSASEATQLFDALVKAGMPAMPLQRTDWAESYGICIDQFGVQWMIMYTGDVVKGC